MPKKAKSNPTPRWIPWAAGAAGVGAATLLVMALRDGGKYGGQRQLVDGLKHFLSQPGTPTSAPTTAPTMTTGPVPTERGRVYIQNGTLYGPIGDPTLLTDEDMLWLGRAIVGETGGRNEEWAGAVAWALAQNMKLIRRSRPFTTFTGIVRAYCQPVNPKWLSLDAEGCRRAPHMCTERHLARRRGYVRMTWSELPEATRRAVTAFRAGTLPNPVPGAVDWHAHHFEGATTEIGGNWFGVASGRRLA